MTGDDLDRIERELNIKLPQSYRALLQRYPIPAYAGNAESQVWDNPKRLIEFNRELRAGAPGGVKPWPPTMFATGHAGDGCPIALDLSDGDAVWWVDHSHLDNPGSHKAAPSFEAWALQYFAQLREELVGDGIDPDGTPDERTLVQTTDPRWFLGCVVTLLIVIGLVVLMRLLGR